MMKKHNPHLARFAATVRDRRRWPAGADTRWLASALRELMLARGVNERQLGECVARIFADAIPVPARNTLKPTRATTGQISAWVWGKVRPRVAVAIAFACALRCESLREIMLVEELDERFRRGDRYLLTRYPHYVAEIEQPRGRP